MEITQTITPIPQAGKRGVDNQATFVTKQEAFQDTLTDTTVTQLNTLATQINTAQTAMATSESNSKSSETNAATSAATATAKALLAQSVVIPTGSAYAIATQDWRDTMMSKAEFNAVAAERRANRAGSGFDEYGKHYTSNPSVNEGLWCFTTLANKIGLGYSGTSGSTVSKTSFPILNINGVNSSCRGLYDGYDDRNIITLPPAPTVLPSTATLTQQQIDSGVIKHADTSNSGLILNGKIDTTANWTAVGGTLSVSSGKLLITNGTSTEGQAYQAFTTVVGKKYVLEIYNEDGTSLTNGIRVGTAINGSTLVNLSNVASATRSEVEFTATALTTYITMATGSTVTGETAIFDNIAVFPSDAKSRSDLFFIESFHEDISEKDFVYPLGNVQYLGTTGDAGTTVVGAFAGAVTYSLFSDTWQADSALIGKGYVWSTLSDANKKAFVANPENNCYLDGDKVIQVRYRIRVVMGWGDSFTSYDPNLHTGLFGYSSVVPTIIKTKGKQVSANDYIISLYTEGVFRAVSDANVTDKISGQYKAFSNTTESTTLAYEGKCFAMPIALVHRRNQGGYNLTYNPHGTKAMTMTPTSIADCFTEANLTVATGYIGASTPRPDGLFYDQVSVEDFKPTNKGADLRNTSKKRTAQNIIEEFAPKVIAGTIPYYNNDTTPLTTYKDAMEVRDTSGNRYGMTSKVGNVVTIGLAVANKKGFSVVTANGKQYLQVADDAVSDATVQMNLSTIKYDIGVFDA